MDVDNPLALLQATACTYRIALGPRAGQLVLSLRSVASRTENVTQALCAAAQGFRLHAAVRCGAHQRKGLERLCRTITRPAIANERVKRDGAGNVVLQLTCTRAAAGSLRDGLIGKTRAVVQQG